MPRLAASLTYLFTELPMLERFAAAGRAGFRGAEVLFPYDLDSRAIVAACQGAGLEFVMLSTPPPNWAGGPRGFAALPAGETLFRQDFDRALRLAQDLRARHIHIVAGRAEGEVAHRTMVRNLVWASARAPHASLLIAPIGAADLPGYFLSDFDLAAAVLDEVAAPNLGLLFDACHAQRITGDALSCWDQHGHRARHVKIAGSPDRHEPTTGEIDYARFFRRLSDAHYRGWVTAEYIPRTTTEAGLGWLAETAR